MAGLFGIENLKKAYALLIAVGMQIEKSAEGGFQKNEIFDFFDELMLVPGVGSAIKQIGQEAGELDETEQQEIRDYVKTTFDLKNDEVEGVVESANGVAVAFADLISKIAALKKKPATPGGKPTPGK